MTIFTDEKINFSPQLNLNFSFSYLSIKHPSLQRGVRWTFNISKQKTETTATISLNELWAILDYHLIQNILASQVDDIFYKNFSLKIIDTEKNQDIVQTSVDAPANYIGRVNQNNLERAVDSRFSAAVFKFYYSTGKNKTQTTTFKIYGVPLENLKPTKAAPIIRLENNFHTPLKSLVGPFSIQYKGLTEKYGNILQCSVTPDYRLLKHIQG